MSFSIDNVSLIKQIFDLLQNHFGEEVEFVFHDNTLDYEHTIVDIRNGQVTGRTIGDSGDILGLEALSGIRDNSYNLINSTKDDRILRSSTQFIRDNDGKICACVAINEDITKSIELERYLQSKNGTKNRSNSGIDKLYHGDVTQMLEFYIESAQTFVGKAISEMNKEDKLLFLDYLDRRGVLLISKAGVRLCEILNVSKFTLYNYLDAVREKRREAEANASLSDDGR